MRRSREERLGERRGRGEEREERRGERRDLVKERKERFQ